MSYKDFSLRKVKQDFKLTLVEGGRFLPSLFGIVALIEGDRIFR
ncbi:MAG: hypothetical protein RMZ69_19270 [Nostoc sp. ChiQUE01a]|nr:hypothetical protein [Nostoc sp. ChiQUE01a]